jgi:L-rhamnose isomerase/sugar isomerase
MTAQQLYAKAALIDHQALETARNEQRIIDAENVLKDAFETDVRPMVRAWRERRGLAPDPLLAFRENGYTERAVRERGGRKKGEASYA